MRAASADEQDLQVLAVFNLTLSIPCSPSLRPAAKTLPDADVGDEARLGHIMKLTGNFYIASAIELIAEGMNMGERSGLSRDTLLEFYSYMLPGMHCHLIPTKWNSNTRIILLT